MLMMIDTGYGAVLVQRDHTGPAGTDRGVRAAGRGLLAEPVVHVALSVVLVVLLENVYELHEPSPLEGVQPATPRK